MILKPSRPIGLTFGSESLTLIRMQTWSDSFKAYIERRFGEGAQQKAAIALKTAQSKIHYWCHGARAREATRKSVERWSKGEVKADLPASGETRRSA